jgi:putative membrane protein
MPVTALPVLATVPVAVTAPDPWWTAWVLDLPGVAVVAGALVLYLRGQQQLAAQAQRRPRRTAAFVAGCGVVLIALVTPVAGWSGHLLWVHMVQHLLLVIVAAPLLALGRPIAAVRRALPPAGRSLLARWTRAARRGRRRIGNPHPLVLATAAHVGALWAWHAPAAYDLAVHNAGVHLLEHATFLGTAVWFWSEVIASARRNAQALATLCLGALIVQGGVLGALLTFAGASIYAAYDGAAGFTAVQDQEFAGALMWVPPGLLYAAVAIRQFVAWMGATDAAVRQRERRRRAAPIS